MKNKQKNRITQSIQMNQKTKTIKSNKIPKREIVER